MEFYCKQKLNLLINSQIKTMKIEQNKNSDDEMVSPGY